MISSIWQFEKDKREVKIKMRLVGLTGSIGCGKSTVCSLIEEGDVINLDEIAHELLRAGTGATKLVAARFPDCVASDGSIDRQLLGPKIFSSVSDRKWLNRFLCVFVVLLFLTSLGLVQRHALANCFVLAEACFVALASQRIERSMLGCASAV